MVRSYCVDGTNLVRSGGYGGPQFREQEDADTRRLVAALGELCRRLEGQAEVEVFFDGAARAVGAAGPGLTVRFSHETAADELILDRVRSRPYAGGGKVTVVTGDGELGRLAEEEGGTWLRVSPGAPLESVLSRIERRFNK